MKQEPIRPQIVVDRASYGTSVSLSPSQGERAQSGADYLRMIWKRKWIVLLVTLVGTACGLTAGLRQIPRYQARLTLELQPPNEGFLNLNELAPTQESSQFLDTQIGLLQSGSLMRKAIHRLGETSDKKPQYDPSAWARLMKSLGLPATAPTYS